MRTLLIAFGISALIVGSAANAQGTPVFAGTWELNTEKGENLGMVAALKETLVISQTAEQITLEFSDTFQVNTTTRQVNYDLSGEPVNNYAAMGERRAECGTEVEKKTKHTEPNDWHTRYGG